MNSVALAVTMELDVESAWERYKGYGCPKAREALILRYAPMVKHVAGRVKAGLHGAIDFDDLVSLGNFGLLDAVERFDPCRDVKFETYAVRRIRGAIVDGLRTLDWLPRTVRQKAKEIESAVAALEARLGRRATEEEVCNALNVTSAEYRGWLSDVQAATVLSLDEGGPSDSDSHHGGWERNLADPMGETPFRSLEIVEVQRLLADAIDRLPERERLVVALYYYEELSVKEVAHVLGVSVSRVSQLHTRAIARLQAQLGRMRESLVS